MEKTLIQNEKPGFKAVIVGLFTDSRDNAWASDDAGLDELEELVKTAGGEVLARATQTRTSPDAHTYVGEGKAREAAEIAENAGADMLIFDHELLPSHVKELEKLTKLTVIDRSGIILMIFAQRARTSEGKLQVQLAQYKYLLPRLTGRGAQMSRQGAGVLARGPGETKLETDRRHIRSLMAKLGDDLDDVRKMRANQRKRREKSDIPTIALIGYTNAGKSTLLNKLTGSEIEANDRLFDTLDTTTRNLRIGDTLEVTISDTVGFIRKLPHHLIEAFKATLEELAFADLIIHVIDASNPMWREQAEVAEKLADELTENAVPRLRVFNKCDKCDADMLLSGSDAICLSAKTGENTDVLLRRIAEIFADRSKKAVFNFPYAKAAIVEMLHRDAKVISAQYTDDGITVEAMCKPSVYGKIKEYEKND